MKTEQRCGRLDRISQQQDVRIYNFSVSDMVDNLVLRPMAAKRLMNVFLDANSLLNVGKSLNISGFYYLRKEKKHKCCV